MHPWLEVELQASCRTFLRLADIEAAVRPMNCEVTSQLVASDSANMAAEIESNLSRSGDEVSITKKVHSLHISIDKQVFIEEIVSNIRATHWQRHEDGP